jgi:hypothetical protein
MKAGLYGLCYQMKTFEFLFGLSLAIETLAVTDLLATQLQAKDLSAQSGKEMGHMAIKTLVGLKSEFARFWSQVLAKAQELRIEEPKLPRKKLKPSRFFEKKEGSDSPETAKQHYEKMFIAAFEKNIECLENRFNQNGLEYYEALQQVLILAASKKNYDTELKKILGFYNNERSHDFDEDILKTQLQIFSKNFPLKEQLSIIDIENYFKELEPSSRKLLSEVGKILELVLVLPATNPTSERKF